MKKIFLSVMLAGALLTSCDLNQSPVGAIPDTEAIQTNLDALKFRNGLYVMMRSLTNGGYITNAEIQGDMFVGVLNNDNRMGPLSLGDITSADGDVAGQWSYPYQIIANVNYYLSHLEPMIAKEGLAADKKLELVRYRGEALWVRAFCYYYLVDHFCDSYTNIDPKTKASGVPLQLVYLPTGDYSKYPSRATLEESFAQIEKDLAGAMADLKEFEASNKSMLVPNASGVSTMAITAFQSRLALLKGDNATAAAKAEEVINSKIYTLCNPDEYIDMWKVDKGNELIFRPFANAEQSGGVSAPGTTWTLSNGTNADYIGTVNCLNMYDKDNDIRYITFFEDRAIDVEGAKVNAPCFVKYPGNPEFNSGSTNAMKNLSKPFRLSELYLIAAEAYAATDVVKANAMLNALRAARIEGWEDTNYSGSELVNQIREERAKELIGEGFRISDLRRWKLGFSRNVAYTGTYANCVGILAAGGGAVSYPSGDYRYVLPIPKGEMEANPQLTGEQNPGYGNN